MSEQPAVTPDPPRRPGLGTAVAVLAAWYALTVVFFLAVAQVLSNEHSGACVGLCVSDREGMLIAGVVTGGPALLVLFGVSVFWAVRMHRTGRWAPSVTGTRAALPALLLVGWSLVLAVTSARGT
ncbi:hypothetical protein MRQ36_17985 [Micromonospora sp. R77]|uniref:hypothetical protein n=1 Tax=Micromonospora sp. R77 TaxID=2925836 RepID=UPI001F603B0A|nr:hypothetical protein [Micromonospora sp. R77]MCI4064387.1 hypothetical protein [Micromonospora sp. R77]